MFTGDHRLLFFDSRHPSSGVFRLERASQTGISFGQTQGKRRGKIRIGWIGEQGDGRRRRVGRAGRFQQSTVEILEEIRTFGNVQRVRQRTGRRGVDDEQRRGKRRSETTTRFFSDRLDRRTLLITEIPPIAIQTNAFGEILDDSDRSSERRKGEEEWLLVNVCSRGRRDGDLR